jgi:peptidoglycan/xylan/chitin deacetylase (PgdA/CDA1 family)
MKPSASISLDLDNKWSYMKTHGDQGWDSYPTYLDVLLPRLLDFLHVRDLHFTFFIVGQDASLEKNREALSLITRAGHEVGNHSFRHEPWLHRYTEDEVRDEIQRAQDVIEEVTGVRPTGFRGPGFSVTSVVLQTLKDLEYRFDCSTFPTFIGPVARAYYFMTAKMTKEDRETRDELFGSVTDGLRPLTPYRWDLNDGHLLEIPVTTMPLIRAPFHISYVLYLSTFSPTLASGYFQSAVMACRAAGVEPSLLLHPLDFLGADDVEGLDFFPAMNISGDLKRERVAGYLEQLRAQFDVVPLGEHARRLESRGSLPLRRPNFQC